MWKKSNNSVSKLFQIVNDITTFSHFLSGLGSISNHSDLTKSQIELKRDLYRINEPKKANSSKPRNIPMTILNETAQRVKDKLALEYDTITIERVMIGVFLKAR